MVGGRVGLFLGSSMLEEDDDEEDGCGEGGSERRLGEGWGWKRGVYLCTCEECDGLRCSDGCCWRRRLV
jgi:hypothetical protein